MSATVTAARSQASDFVEMTKPRIALLVLVTTYSGMWLAANGVLPLDLAVITLLGTGLASAASGVFNNYIDRDIDKLMSRTRNRALPTGRMDPQLALAFGSLLAFTAFVILFFWVNPLTAWLAIGTIFFYVVIYTAWLKRSSPLCTEVGGVAGALPPVIGWAAVTGEIGWPALVMFLIMFLWQPPHFWALALLRVEEYRRAGIPMLPVARGTDVTKFRMLAYTVALIPATVAMYWLDLVGLGYLVVALSLGLIYLRLTINFVIKPVTPQGARRLFGFSIIYLLILFIMIFVNCQCNGTFYNGPFTNWSV
ncbi:MAG: protoheme IX farnesyltransferase [Proteobacteria bacterium]|nr:protoheme IX farnesyltransferase [Pseudomonadota bacterium]